MIKWLIISDRCNGAVHGPVDSSDFESPNISIGTFNLTLQCTIELVRLTSFSVQSAYAIGRFIEDEYHVCFECPLYEVYAAIASNCFDLQKVELKLQSFRFRGTGSELGLNKWVITLNSLHDQHLHELLPALYELTTIGVN